MSTAVATIKDVDEHGPIIEWHQHWAELKGRTLYLTQPAQAVDDETLLDVARRVGLRQQFTGVNATDTKFLLRAFVDALPNANGKEG